MSIDYNHTVIDKLRYEVHSKNDFKCQNCGYQGYWRDRKLSTHHIDCSGQTANPNDSFENLCTLCWNCHPKAHRLMKWLSPEV